MKVKRRTIKKEFVLEGKGLHRGRDNFLILKPNTEDKGIIFLNPDRASKIVADIDSVSSLERGTVLKSGDLEISTVEHLLSAAFAFDIDDLIIEIKGDEIPAMDGSSKFFAQMFEKAGFIEKDDDADCFKADGDIIFENGNSFYRIEKADSFYIECVFENSHPLIGKQSLNIEINEENYVKEIAPAKTFGFEYEMDYLRKNNLALGANLSNAIVLTKDAMLNPSVLSFKDEFVRHKILDLLGDLKIAGLRIRKTKITALRPSHKNNYDLAKLIYTRSKYGEK